MVYRLFFISSVILGAACAGTPQVDGEPYDVARGDLVCENETPTGSHLPKRVCRYQSDIDDEEAKVRLLEERMRDRIPHAEIRKPGGTP